MVDITYVSSTGEAVRVSAEAGSTVMQTAVSNGVTGIVAECGGSAMCATCHVYVPEDWASKLPPVSETEDAMLDSTISERRPSSRLSCQIQIVPELDGLVVHLPERQV